MPPTIFSVGYQKLTQDALVKLVLDLDCVLIDCRSYPSGRVKKGFSKKDLAATLGERYEWWGKELGGYDKEPTRAGLDRLKADDRRLMLMCKEHYPSECHRHQGIAVPLAAEGVPVRHVFENEVILAHDLEVAIAADQEYEYEDLFDVIRVAKGGDVSPPLFHSPARRPPGVSMTALPHAGTVGITAFRETADSQQCSLHARIDVEMWREIEAT